MKSLGFLGSVLRSHLEAGAGFLVTGKGPTQSTIIEAFHKNFSERVVNFSFPNFLISRGTGSNRRCVRTAALKLSRFDELTIAASRQNDNPSKPLCRAVAPSAGDVRSIVSLTNPIPPHTDSLHLWDLSLFTPPNLNEKTC
jgi:hypothetical protein